MKPAFRVGDHVQIPLGRRTFAGVVIEDRGAIGVRGRRLYQVSVPMDPFDPAIYELPEDEIEPMEGPSEIEMDKREVAHYLANGGLIAILWSNMDGARDQPRAWVRPDTLGNVTHTFVKHRGILGGGDVPFMAIRDNKVFAPKRGEVSSFLQSFEFDRAEAEKILKAVGTAP